MARAAVKLSLSLLHIANAAEAVPAAHESAGVAALGLDLPALVFQVINFAILLGILHFVVYKPIIRILDERRARIAESLATAKKIDKEKQAIAATKKASLAQTQQETTHILEHARAEAQKIVAQATAQAKAEQQQTLQATERKVEEQLSAAKKDLRHTVLQLVAAATEKIIAAKVDSAKDRTLIEQRVNELL